MKTFKIFLLITTALILSLSIFGCAENVCELHVDENTDYICDECNQQLEKPNPDPEPEPEPEPDPVIVVPEYKDYERDTVDFDKMIYARPDFDSAIAKFEALCELIEANEVGYDEQLQGVYNLEADYTEITSMYSLLEIYTSIDTANEEWAEEYEYVTTTYPEFTQAIENLYVSAANSPHAEAFEVDYFGDDLIEEYRDGGIYTDTMVALMADEAELISTYSALSTATVEVTYLGKTDTVDNILEYYEDTYGKDSTEYKSAKSGTANLYEIASVRKSKEILVDLFKVRRKIADELGYESYSTYAYDTIYHDYSEDEMREFLIEVSSFILPVYVELAYNTDKFAPYFNENPKIQSVDKVSLINNSYGIIGGIDNQLKEIYSYMLQHKLYDIEPMTDNRYAGAFTTYIDKYNAPFLLISSNDNALDYMTMFHEFGHFADNYINNGQSSSLDLAEVSSQGLEYIAMTRLDSLLDTSSIRYLKVSKMAEACEILLYQGFYSLFEHYAYELEYDEITEENLNKLVADAAGLMGLNSEFVNRLDYVLIPHIVEYPFYVQSYCTSLVASLSILEMETKEEGAGLEAYLNLIDREGEDKTFEEYLGGAGITSPLADGRIREAANFIYRYMTGKNYFSS